MDRDHEELIEEDNMAAMAGGARVKLWLKVRVDPWGLIDGGIAKSNRDSGRDQWTRDASMARKPKVEPLPHGTETGTRQTGVTMEPVRTMGKPESQKAKEVEVRGEAGDPEVCGEGRATADRG